jgi:hypothetical protein
MTKVTTISTIRVAGPVVASTPDEGVVL